jgi:hypothetical protein
MNIRNLDDLKIRIVGISVRVVVIVIVERLVKWERPMETVPCGAAIARVTLALLVFNRFPEETS